MIDTIPDYDVTTKEEYKDVDVEFETNLTYCDNPKHAHYRVWLVRWHDVQVMLTGGVYKPYMCELIAPVDMPREMVHERFRDYLTSSVRNLRIVQRVQWTDEHNKYDSMTEDPFIYIEENK